MTEVEFAEQSKELREDLMLFMRHKLEELYGGRIHMSVGIVVVNKEGQPSAVVFSDTMAGRIEMTQIMAYAYAEKLAAESEPRPPAERIN